MRPLRAVQHDAITRRDLIDAAVAAAVVAVVVAVFFRFDRTAFWKDDFQLQYLPATREVVRAWSEGSFPLLSRFSWFGGALAGEFQHGVFSIFATLCNLLVWSLPLELPARAAMLSIIHLGVMAAGVSLLARSFGLRGPFALSATCIVGLNGWNLWWGAATWYPALASFAWLPWYWLALRKRSWLGGGVALYCLVTAGWPYTVLMAGVVTLIEWSPAAIASAALGLGLSAPATLMLVEYFRAGARAATGALLDPRWTLPPSALVGFALPTARTMWKLWSAPAPHAAVELSGALLPVSALIAVLVAKRWSFFREFRSELIALVAIVGLATLPSVGILRWPFRWLPLAHLLLALAGMAAAQEVRRLGAWVCGTLGAALLVAAAVDQQFVRTLQYAAVMLCVAVLYAIARRAVVAMALAPSVVLFLVFPQPHEVPTWHFDRSILSAAPLDPVRRTFQLARWPEDFARAEEGFGESLRPGNTPMLAGVDFVNGYSPVGPGGMRALFDLDTHGPIFARSLNRVAVRETAPGALLDHMSVDSLMVANVIVDRATPVLARRGWTLSARVADGAIFTRPLQHLRVWCAARALQFADEDDETAWIAGRPAAAMPVSLTGATPAVRAFAPRALSEIRDERLVSSVRVGPAVSSQNALVVFSRPWYPGFRATIDGREVPVVCVDRLMPAVELAPADQGLLVLRYRPASLVAGVAVAMLAIIAALVSRMWGGRWRAARQ